MTFVRPRLAYLGTPEIAVAPLQALVKAGFDVRLVVSAPDARRGRGSGKSPSPVKAAALAAGLPVTDRLADVLDAEVDLGVVVAYGEIIPVSMLERTPMVNLHFSLLPRWRGAAPVERAILAGDTETGVCVMEVVEALDAGGVYSVATTPVADKTLDELWQELSTMGSELLVETLSQQLADPTPQTGEETYAHKLSVDDRRINWSDDAEQCARVVRLGRAWTTLAGDRFRVVAATVGADVARFPGTLVVGADRGPAVACGAGSVELLRVQPAGKAEMDADAWAHGRSGQNNVVFE